jgi:hypothetical protein
MPRDIAPLTNALDETTPGNQTDVYTLLAAWDTSIEAALERGGEIGSGWSRSNDARE